MALQADGRLTNADLAQRVGPVGCAVLAAVRLLEERGFITGYRARSTGTRSAWACWPSFAWTRSEHRRGARQMEEAIARLA